MEVIRGGSAAAGAVVEQGESAQLPRKLEEVGHPSAGDRLRRVCALDDGVMAAEDGERVDQEQVTVVEAGQGVLLRRPIGVAEEAGALADGGRVGAGTGRDDASRVKLDVDAECAEAHCADAYVVEGLVVLSGHGPMRQVALQERLCAKGREFVCCRHVV